MPEPPLLTHPDDQRRLEALLARTWSLVREGEHTLGRLQGLPLGPYRLLALLGPKNNVGARYFQLFPAGGGRLSEEPLSFGLHNSGPYPGYNWLEVIRYEPAPRLGPGRADIRTEGLEEPLFRALSELVPVGGHLMVEYDSPSQRESERILGLGYPPAATPLGFLLLRAGCRSFRDWYISEGGREGPRKLQGYKPLNGELARERTAALQEQVEGLLARPAAPRHGEYGLTARRLARAVLEALEGEARP